MHKKIIQHKITTIKIHSKQVIQKYGFRKESKFSSIFTDYDFNMIIGSSVFGTL